MKFLHVINSLIRSGGAEQGLVRKVMAFPSGIEHLIVTLDEGGPLEPQLVEAEIRHQSRGHSSSRSGWNWPLAALRLRTVIGSLEPDVIQSSLFSGNLATQIAARFGSIPTLSTFTLSGDKTDSSRRPRQPIHFSRVHQPAF